MIKRTLTQTLINLSQSFPVIMLTGARQVGKTTLLESLAKNRTYITLDDLDNRYLAQNDPALFLQRYKTPIIIDEIQYAPELFSYIKIAVDKSKQNGEFWLTGSQKFHLMQNVTESLAGRVAIIDMLGLSQAEINNKSNSIKPFLPTQDWIQSARDNSIVQDIQQVYNRIWQGSFPALYKQNINEDIRNIFYSSYIQTYIRRDIQSLIKVEDELIFNNFLKAIAARTGQLLNYASVARDVGIAPKTVKSWLSILESSGLIYLLYPYHNNITKRIIKTPKIYFLDTGLASYLTSWTTPETLEAGAMSGAILETYIIAEILKSYLHNGKQANFYFYRDADQKEIDLLIERDGKLYPIEFKKTAIPSNCNISFQVLHKLDKIIAEGAVICLKQTDIIIKQNMYAIPVSYL